MPVEFRCIRRTRCHYSFVLCSPPCVHLSLLHCSVVAMVTKNVMAEAPPHLEEGHNFQLLGYSLQYSIPGTLILLSSSMQQFLGTVDPFELFHALFLKVLRRLSSSGQDPWEFQCLSSFVQGFEDFGGLSSAKNLHKSLVRMWAWECSGF